MKKKLLAALIADGIVGFLVLSLLAYLTTMTVIWATSDAVISFPTYYFVPLIIMLLVAFALILFLFVCLAICAKRSDSMVPSQFRPCLLGGSWALMMLALGGLIAHIVLFATEGNIGPFTLSSWVEFLLLSLPYFVLLLFSALFCSFLYPLSKQRVSKVK